MAYFDTAGASNGPTEAIDGIIELGRRTARGYRTPTNYQLRMLLIAGGLDASTHTQLSKAVKTAETQGKTGLLEAEVEAAGS